MKKLQTIIILTILFLYTSCNSDRKKLIVGKWQAQQMQLDSAYYNAKLLAAGYPKAQVVAMIAHENEKRQQKVKEIQLTFGNDGTLVNSRSDKGYYAFIDGYKKIVTTSDGENKKDTITVKELTKDKLVIITHYATVTFAPMQ